MCVCVLGGGGAAVRTNALVVLKYISMWCSLPSACAHLDTCWTTQLDSKRQCTGLLKLRVGWGIRLADESLHLCNSAKTGRKCSIHQAKRKRKTTRAVKATPHIYQRKGATLVPSTVKLLHCKKERKNQRGSGGLRAWPETGSSITYPSAWGVKLELYGCV